MNQLFLQARISYILVQMSKGSSLSLPGDFRNYDGHQLPRRDWPEFVGFDDGPTDRLKPLYPTELMSEALQTTLAMKPVKFVMFVKFCSPGVLLPLFDLRKAANKLILYQQARASNSQCHVPGHQGNSLCNVGDQRVHPIWQFRRQPHAA